MGFFDKPKGGFRLSSWLSHSLLEAKNGWFAVAHLPESGLIFSTQRGGRSSTDRHQHGTSRPRTYQTHARTAWLEPQRKNRSRRRNLHAGAKTTLHSIRCAAFKKWPKTGPAHVDAGQNNTSVRTTPYCLSLIHI